MIRFTRRIYQDFYRAISSACALAFLLVFTPTFAATNFPTSNLDSYQAFFTSSQITDEVSARAFLVAHAARYQLGAPETLKLAKQRQSLYSRHYHFQQTFKNLPVDRAEIIISVDLQTKNVVRVYNTTKPLISQSSTTSIAPALSADAAVEKIWRLQIAGSQLGAKPTVRLVYIETAGKPQLVYRVNLLTDKPGNWEYTLNANTGAILTIERLDTPAFMPHDFQRTLDPAQLKQPSVTTSYAQALANFSAKNKRMKKTSRASTRVDGTALVFDPDPITALQNLELTIDSPLEVFEAAYVTRPLKDIELVDGVYHLNGPWAKIEENEDPVTAPSTTTDGNWKAKRNESAFQDAMAYFHIDQSQRYLQSLGFANDTGIQYAPISIDAQGALGMHNAFYSSFDNQISFGVAENCPAMAEDADVILHEYGHAIHYSINPNWYGGDTGAMGEGFADYWAASYSLTTTNGATFYPERMGNWIAFNSCWEDGRLVTRTDTRYQQGKIYAAHEKVGDHWSDELWSAPLYRSLHTLMAQGISREEVDKIILEAHFGLGSEMTMPEMANAIVITARQMHPHGMHAEVFRSNFVLQKILPESVSVENSHLSGTALNNQIQPGDELGLTLELHNNSSKTISGLTPQVSSPTADITLTNDAILPVTVEANAYVPLKLRAKAGQNITCGSNVEFSVQLNYTDPENQQAKKIAQTLSYLVGEPVVSKIDTKPNVKIPGARSEKIISELHVSGLPINTDHFTLHLDLRISMFFAPSITLISPAGTSTSITGITPWLSEVIGNVPGDFGSAQIFAPLAGENPNGTWTLEVVQPALDNPPAGLLKSWGISTITGATCNNKPVEPIALDSIQFSQLYLPAASATGATSFSRNANIKMDYLLRNNSQTDISDISVSLTSPEDISPIRQSAPPTTLPALSTHKGQLHFTMPDQAACGSSLPLKIAYRYNTTQGLTEKETNTHVTVGFPLSSQSYSAGDLLEIPDNDTNGISTNLYIEGFKAFNAANNKIRLSLEHTNPADLHISLRSPAGTEIVLVNPDNTLPTYINDKFPDDIQPAMPLSTFDGENPNGNWVLTVKDTKPGNSGSLLWFVMQAINEFDCDPNHSNSFPIAILANKTFNINEGQTITIDASGSSDANGDTLSFNYEQIGGPIQALLKDTTATPQFVAPQVAEPTTFTYKMRVKDYYGFSAEDTFAITVKKPVAASSSSRSSTPNTNSGGNSGGGGSGNVLLLILLAGCVMCRRWPDK